MISLTDSIRDEGEVLFQSWWTTVGKTKSVSQWHTKLLRLGAKETPDELAKFSIEDVGTVLYTRLTSAGKISETDLQDMSS